MSKVILGFLGGVCIGVIILLIVWGICACAGSSYNPFTHWWIAFAFIIISVAGGFANRDK